MTLMMNGAPIGGRVEFEGFESVQVLLGTGEDTFTIGGKFNLDQAHPNGGQANPELLVTTEFPKNRLMSELIVADAIVETVTEGGPGGNEVQQVTIDGAAGGIFRLAYEGQATGPIDFDAPATGAGSVEQALEALSTVTNVSVARSESDFDSDGEDEIRYTITFVDPANTDVDEILVDATWLMSTPLGIQKIVHTITGMVSVSGGNEVSPAGDTFNVIATNDLDSPFVDRSSVNDAVNLLTVTTTQPGSETQSEEQEVRVSGAANGVGYFTLMYSYAETKPIPVGASNTVVAEALIDLVLIGLDESDNPNVAVSWADDNGDDVYTIKFQNALKKKDVPELEAQVIPLTILGNDGGDLLNVEAIDETLFFLGGNDSDKVNMNVDVTPLSTPAVPITSNGVNATVTLDGEENPDFYEVHLIGGITDSRISVLESGKLGDTAGDRLTVYGTDNETKGDLFLLRAAVARSGLAFIALLNEDPEKPADEQPYERVNYVLALDEIIVEGRKGDDEFYVDDTRAVITINAGEGDDFFQIAQLYKTRRTTELAGVATEDVFATIETTKGWLSNGISEPMTINGEEGEDLFIVFHNLDVLTLNGGDDNDTFIIQAFALAGSQEDQRALTDLSGDAGADIGSED